jgi:hypothetical protein
MAGLEEMMAGLFGGTQAPAGDEMRRRRSGPGGEGGYGGIGGAAVTPGQMMPYYGGVGQYDFSGAMGSQMGGRQGLMSLLGGKDVQGPALRHFANQGFDFGRPGQDNREAPGGPNIAPGNIDNAQALFQPQGPDHVPGIPQGVAVGQVPGQMRPRPQTQGWRNVHPGYSAAAQFGTDQGGNPMGFGGRQQGAPAAAGAPPGASTGGPGGGGGGGGGGAAPQSQNPVGGGGKAVAPAGPTGGGGGGTGGGQSSGGKQTSGGGGGGVSNADLGVGTRGVAGAPERQAADQRAAGGIAAGAGGKKLGGSPMLDALGAIQGLGNEGSSEKQRRMAAPKANNFGDRAQGGLDEGKLAGMTAQEKAKAKASWEAKVAAKQERQRVKAAPSASQFGANSATNDRGSGLDPLPKAGKTKPKGRGSTSAQQR